jgi:hypothetical protein
MTRIIDADDQGTLHLTAELLGTRPHARYAVDLAADQVVLRPLTSPEADVRPLWERLTPSERIEDLRRWAAQSRPKAPSLPDEALRRENMYEE